MTIMFFHSQLNIFVIELHLKDAKGYDYAENNIIWLGDLKQDKH